MSASCRLVQPLTTSAAARPDAAMRMSSGPSPLEREAALGLVELHGGDADVEHDAVGGGSRGRSATARSRKLAWTRSRARRTARAGRAEGQGLSSASSPSSRPPALLEQDAGMATGPDRAVDVTAAVARRQQRDRLGEQDRIVDGLGILHVDVV